MLQLTQTITSMESLEQPYIVDTKIKLPEDLSITATLAYKLSEQASQQYSVSSDTLILVKFKDGMFHYAIAQYPFLLNTFQHVYDLFTKKPVLCHKTAIRILKFLPQITYQPTLPEETLAIFFRSLYKTLQHQGLQTFLSARIIPSSSHIISIGDLHGHAKALRYILRQLCNQCIINKKGALANDSFLVFTGDLTDRGPDGPQIWHMVMELKNRNPQQVFVLRGNHETINSALFNNFLAQMQECTELNRESVIQFLINLFSTLPFGVLLGVAPKDQDYSENPKYRFIFFCHGGNDPIVPLKRFMQQIVQAHKKSGQEEFYHHFSHPYPEDSGFLWTDYRANRFAEEPATRDPSLRDQKLHLFNMSAVLDFFDEHVSSHPKHPYSLDCMVRGHQHLVDGIGRLNCNPSFNVAYDWIPLVDKEKEIIMPSSVYTCISATKWALPSDKEVTSYLDIGYYEEEKVWHLAPYIHSKPKRILEKEQLLYTIAQT